MPIYRMFCNDCNKAFDKFSVRVGVNPPCHCGSTDVKKLPTTAALKFVGDGFHQNDYPTADRYIGAKAEKKWEEIHERTAQRDRLANNMKVGEEVVIRDNEGNYAVQHKDSMPETQYTFTKDNDNSS